MWESFGCQGISVKHAVKMLDFRIHLIHSSSKPWSTAKHCWCSVGCACTDIIPRQSFLLRKQQDFNENVFISCSRIQDMTEQEILLEILTSDVSCKHRSCAQAATSVDSSSWIANFPKDASLNSPIVVWHPQTYLLLVDEQYHLREVVMWPAQHYNQ